MFLVLEREQEREQFSVKIFYKRCSSFRERSDSRNENGNMATKDRPRQFSASARPWATRSRVSSSHRQTASIVVFQRQWHGAVVQAVDRRSAQAVLLDGDLRIPSHLGQGIEVRKLPAWSWPCRLSSHPSAWHQRCSCAELAPWLGKWRWHGINKEKGKEVCSYWDLDAMVEMESMNE